MDDAMARAEQGQAEPISEKRWIDADLVSMVHPDLDPWFIQACTESGWM